MSLHVKIMKFQKVKSLALNLLFIEWIIRHIVPKVKG